VVISKRGTVTFEVWDSDKLSADDLIGKATVTIGPAKLDTSITLEIVGKKDKHYQPKCMLTVRFQRLNPETAGAVTKTIFCIRHGESYWNEAQEKADLIGMYERRDHPLNEIGMEQAMHLRAAWKGIEDGDKDPAEFGMTVEDFEEFKAAQKIFASPLCRASQTCVLGLMGHPTLMAADDDGGIHLMSNLRESKKIGGLDTAASTCGEDIRKRAEKKIVDKHPDMESELAKIKWDFNDTYEKWWTEYYDGKEEILRRFEDVFELIRYIPQETIILVGHSLFFQAFFRNYLGDVDGSALDEMVVGGDDDVKEGADEAPDDAEAAVVPKDKKSLYAMLKKKKLMNAGCAKCIVDFSDDGKKAFQISDVKLCFGTKLV
jgi:broad specificity phosphatase PhoE